MWASLSRCVLCPESLTDQAAVSLCGGGGARRRWGKCETRDDFKSRATSTSAASIFVASLYLSAGTTYGTLSGTPFGAGDRGPASTVSCRPSPYSRRAAASRARLLLFNTTRARARAHTRPDPIVRTPNAQATGGAATGATVVWRHSGTMPA